jgi:hypothetical protein
MARKRSRTKESPAQARANAHRRRRIKEVIASVVKRSFHLHENEQRILAECEKRTGWSRNRSAAFLMRAGFTALHMNAAQVEKIKREYAHVQKMHGTKVAAQRQIARVAAEISPAAI